jgi:E3 ubiquitin-protein ligase RNF14
MEDERAIELDCIAAIFPELLIDPENPFSASIELEVKPAIPVKVVFPASAEGSAANFPTPPLSFDSGDTEERAFNAAINIESHNLSYLPSLHLRIILPEGYPAECVPQFELSTTPAWLSQAQLDELQANGARLWEEGGHCEVVYGFIDFLQQAAETAFGHADGKALEVPQEFKIALLDFDIKATQAAFDKETFDCGVCLDPKKGSVCHRMLDCGHVFCVQCLQDFYNNAIKEGDLVSVRCLAPDCAKKRADSQVKKSRKPKTQLSPSELLQIPLEHETVTRYVKLKHKADLEADRNTVYCPRKWCQGAARSKKHRKPDGFEDMDSENESEGEESQQKSKFRAGNDLLCVCEDCSFAFCSRCYQGWHGEFTLCVPKKPTGELTDEDKASLEYLKLHTTPCPTCAAPAQKTHGCNHMICFKCNTHFCYLCSAWLEPSNPYKHYNIVNNGCYMRLWEQEAADGDDFVIGYVGGVQEIDHQEVVVLDEPPDDEPPIEAPVVLEPAQEPVIVEARPQGELQREGPLVLRINAPPPPPRAVPAVPDAPQPEPARNRRRGMPNRRIPGPGAARQGEPIGAGFVRGGGRGAARQEAVVQAREVAAQEQEAAHQAWVQRFVQMALNDEEDQLEWDSDDEEDAAAWEIPVR